MRNSCYVLLLALAFSLVAFALPEPNFSGTWAINQINGQAVPGASHAVSITQKGNEFVVESDRRSPMTKQEYVTDGTERKLAQIGTPTLTYYTAKWEENSLVIDKESNYTSPNGGLTIPFRTRELWSISVDGKNLTHSMTIGVETSKSNHRTITEVFTKVDIQ